jgi:hypothetical protein
MSTNHFKTFSEVSALLDYYYDELPESERSTFVMQLLDCPPPYEIPFEELFCDCPEFNEGNYELIQAFALKFNNNRPEEYSEKYEFIELELTDIAFFLGDLEQIGRSLAVLGKNPVAGIDTVVKKVLFQLLFNGYYKEAIQFSELAWKPLRDSDKLWGYPEYIFTYTLYLSKLEEQYKLLQSGNASSWEVFRSEINEFGFDSADKRMEPIYTILSQKGNDSLIVDNLPKNMKDQLLILNIHFLIYMQKTYAVPFMLSDWWFNLIQDKQLFGKNKEPGKVFYVPYKELDKYITGKLDTLLGSNYYEMFGKIWGLHFVYEFLYKFSLISEPWYNKMTESLVKLKTEFIDVIGRDFWQMHYLCKWPGENIPGNLLIDKDQFNLSFSTRNIGYKESIEDLFGFMEEDKSFNDDFYEEIITKDPHPHEIQNLVKDPYKPYQKTEVEPGRNNPCPCGSGKKYKKCCMKKGILDQNDTLGAIIEE